MEEMLMVMRWETADEEAQQERLEMRGDVRKGLYTGEPKTESEDKVE
jgi:hypothetical protein